jgi:hypothetical protein
MKHNIDHKSSGKHCHNCKWLEWAEGDWGDPEGWVCNKRDYDTVEQETTHLNQMKRERYRFKGKKCFETKAH